MSKQFVWGIGAFFLMFILDMGVIKSDGGNFAPLAFKALSPADREA